MKSSKVAVAMLAVLVTGSAYAAYTDIGNVVTEQSALEKVKTTVKVTVQSVLDYWYGTKPPAAAEPVAQKTPKDFTSDKTAESEIKSAPAPQPSVAAPAPAKAEATDAQKELRGQPLFAETAEGSSVEDVKALRNSLKGASVLAVAKAGRAGTSKLAKSKEGVPVVDFKKMKIAKKIPRLDIGTEDQISRKDFQITKLSWGLQKPSELKRLPSPSEVNAKEVAKALSTPIEKALGPRGMQANLRPAGKPITRDVVDKVQYTVLPVPEVKPLPYKPLSEEHLKMVAALILFEKGNHCHMIMGLFNQLAKAELTKDEATYHLGACADTLGMHQAAFDHLSGLVAKEDKEYAKDALRLLAKDLPGIYEEPFYKVMKSVKAPKALITDDSRDDVTYRMAKGAYRAGDFKTSAVYAGQVSEKADFYDDARFLIAMNSFALGDKTAALKKLQELWANLESRKVPNNNIRALVAVNLARMNFAAKKYDKALDNYMQVPKDHALWVQALIEQGWTQLALEDYSGAIGNMYSLHSPYFKAVYQPESFVVRTIGYLNICQYGDAYKTLSWMEKDYREWNEKTVAYLSTHSEPLAIYNTVKSYIRGKSDQGVEGVPFQVWREMARRKDFLNLQTALNDKQDETKRYEGVNEKIKTEKASIRYHAEQSKKQFDIWKSKVASVKTDKGQKKNLDQYNANMKLEKDRTVGYRFKLAILEQSRQGYLDFQKTSQVKLDKETVALSVDAGKLLLKRANQMKTEMARVLENNEFLRYEVFAGSGENIRYQVAGGEVSGQVNRIPASIKPTKMMNWNFDGEYWEDEIGSYRSSLQNNCPTTAQQPEQRQEGDQAKLHDN